MIELQKKYARDLLTHVNPYTGNAYTRRAGDCLRRDQQRERPPRDLGLGPDRSSSRALCRHVSQALERLAQGEVWQHGATPQGMERGRGAAGPELLRNGDFASALESPWNLERDDDDAGRLVDPGRRAGRPPLLADRREPARDVSRGIPSSTRAGSPSGRTSPTRSPSGCRAGERSGSSVNAMQAHDPGTSLASRPRWNSARSGRRSGSRSPWIRTTRTPGSAGPACIRARTSWPTCRCGRAASLGVRPEQRLEDASVPVLKKAR